MQDCRQLKIAKIGKMVFWAFSGFIIAEQTPKLTSCSISKFLCENPPNRREKGTGEKNDGEKLTMRKKFVFFHHFCRDCNWQFWEHLCSFDFWVPSSSQETQRGGVRQPFSNHFFQPLSWTPLSWVAWPESPCCICYPPPPIGFHPQPR